MILLKLATVYEWLEARWWAGWVVVLLLLAYAMTRKPATVEKLKIVEHTVVKWKYADRIDTGAGSRTTVSPDGTMIIDGSATITRTGTGESVTDRTTEKTVTVIQTWKIMGGLGLSTEASWPPSPAIDAMVGARIGKVLFLDIGAGVTARAPVTLTGIDRIGLLLFATF